MIMIQFDHNMFRCVGFNHQRIKVFLLEKESPFRINLCYYEASMVTYWGPVYSKKSHLDTSAQKVFDEKSLAYFSGMLNETVQLFILWRMILTYINPQTKVLKIYSPVDSCLCLEAPKPISPTITVSPWPDVSCAGTADARPW